MQYVTTPIPDVYIIELEQKGDERGFFARMFCSDEFTSRGLEGTFVQANDSYSKSRGTLRGLHYQLPPHAETKMVRCLQGSIFDVVVDIRPESPTFTQWFGMTLSSENRKMMYVPEGCAHGFLTLEEDSEILYLVSAAYSPNAERGIRWNDPAFSIEWPLQPVVISERDSIHPEFSDEASQHMLGMCR